MIQIPKQSHSLQRQRASWLWAFTRRMPQDNAPGVGCADNGPASFLLRAQPRAKVDPDPRSAGQHSEAGCADRPLTADLYRL